MLGMRGSSTQKWGSLHYQISLKFDDSDEVHSGNAVGDPSAMSASVAEYAMKYHKKVDEIHSIDSIGTGVLVEIKVIADGVSGK